MHELALVESVVEAVSSRLGDVRVKSVRLEIGALIAVVPDALRFCFDVCTRGTRLEGAVLEIIEIAGCARCRSCGRELSLQVFPTPCECGGFDLEVLSGEELRIRDVEVI